MVRVVYISTPLLNIMDGFEGVILLICVEN